MLLTLIGAGFGWLSLWLLVPDGSVTGLQILFWLLSPVLITMVLGCLGLGVFLIWQGLTRYMVDEDGLTIRLPIGRRHVPWEQVADVAVHAGAFPQRPGTLTLHLTDQRCVQVPLTLRPEKEFRRVLSDHLPMLAEHGFERVRHRPPPKPPSHAMVKLGRNGSTLIWAYPALLFALLSVLGIFMFGKDYLNYWRIHWHHHTTMATVERIEHDEDRVHATIVYELEQGDRVRLRRKVLHGFKDDFEPGDEVTVQYLPQDPGTARIADWDLDGRQWFMLLMLMPFAWLGFFGVHQTLTTLCRPLHEVFAWMGLEREDACGLATHEMAMETLYAILPQRHEGGAIVFKSLKEVENATDRSIDDWAQELTKAGIQAKAVAESFVIVGAEQARRLLDRLGRQRDTIRAEYAVLKVPSVTEAERYTLSELMAEEDAKADQAVLNTRLMNLDGIAFPLEREEVSQALERYLKLQIERLYDGAPPAKMLAVNFATLLKLDPSGTMYHFLIERRARRACLWVRANEAFGATCAEFEHERWTVVANQPVPRALRSGACLGKLGLLALGPLLVLVMPAYLLVSLPFAWFAARRRRKKLSEARQAVVEPPSP
ncbi:MAG: DUF3592 domain-containing protein [Phycisphaeraceae bacterium]